MARSPKSVALLLTEDERARLLGLAWRRRTGQDVAMRARIVLACADPEATNTGIAAPEPGRRVRGPLRGPRQPQPHGSPSSDVRLHCRAGARLGSRG